MSRKSITVTAEAFERLADLKHDDESWTEFWHRAADTLQAESGDDDTEHGPKTVAVENVDEIARAAADEVENRMTRR